MELIHQTTAALINGADFIIKVLEVSTKLGIDPNALMCVMRFETAGTFRPSVRNPFNGATGLIQFTSATAKGLGTSLEALAAMTGVRQLDYVYRFYLPYKPYLRTPEDLYLATFYPRALVERWPDSKILGLEVSPERAKLIQTQNPGMDANKDLMISVGELKAVIRQKVFSGLKKK